MVAQSEILKLSWRVMSPNNFPGCSQTERIKAAIDFWQKCGGGTYALGARFEWLKFSKKI